ncbi:hypothetical protein CGMCC3_g18020 [Colletotrichum fructicola]|nr:uncharacterized protein CGMCC3_g18020 [Colletotrichum fructicola]KAE9565799.1 hypothetical protein CGMCC3_g18020 [Colletotrichum fructicola]
MIILKFRSGVKAEMAYSSVYEPIHSSPGTITLVLSEPPKFYRPGIGLDERPTDACETEFPSKEIHTLHQPSGRSPELQLRWRMSGVST